MKRHTYFKKGFSLVELLFVIAIISLLLSVILATLTEARDRAEDARLVSELRNSSVEIENFYTRNKKYPATVDCSLPESETNTCLPSTSDFDASYTYTIDDPANPQVFVLGVTGGSEDATYIITSSDPNPTLVANDWGIINVNEEGNNVWVEPSGGCIGCNKYDDEYVQSYTSLGAVSEWTNPERVGDTNNIRTYTETLGARQDYIFFESAQGDSVGAVYVALEASSIVSGGSFSVAISKDGNSFTAPITRTTDVTDALHDLQFSVGWTPAEAETMTVRVTSNSDSDNPVRVDHIRTNVIYQSTGGSSGGGGRI